MTQEVQLDSALDTLADYTRYMGNTVVDSNVEGIITEIVRGREYELTGLHIDHGDHTVVVAGHEDLHYVTMGYYLSVPQIIQNSLTESTLQLINEMDDDEYSTIYDVIDTPDIDTWQGYRSHFTLVVSGGGFGTSLYPVGNAEIETVSITKKIFPQEDSFELSRYADSVQSIVTAGSRAAAFLSSSLNINEHEEDPSKTELTLDY